MSGHTPTPWSTNPTGDLTDFIIGTSLVPVAEVYIEGEDAEALANAAIIVRAVNCHEEMVAALREVVAVLGPEPADCGCDGCEQEMAMALTAARSALAKAEEEA